MSPDHSAGTKAALRLRRLQRNLSFADVSAANADWTDAMKSLTESLTLLPPAPQGKQTQPTELPAAWKLEVRNAVKVHMSVVFVVVKHCFSHNYCTSVLFLLLIPMQFELRDRRATLAVHAAVAAIARNRMKTARRVESRPIAVHSHAPDGEAGDSIWQQRQKSGHQVHEAAMTQGLQSETPLALLQLAVGDYTRALALKRLALGRDLSVVQERGHLQAALAQLARGAWLSKRGAWRNTWQRRWCELSTDTCRLTHFTGREPGHQIKGSIALRGAKVVAGSEYCTFSVKTGGTYDEDNEHHALGDALKSVALQPQQPPQQQCTYYFRANSIEECRTWVVALQHVAQMSVTPVSDSAFQAMDSDVRADRVELDIESALVRTRALLHEFLCTAEFVA